MPLCIGPIMDPFEVGTPPIPGRLLISIEISGLMSVSMLGTFGSLQEASGLSGMAPLSCMLHWAMICCCWRYACCLSARSRLYIGPNLLRPPRILSARTAEENNATTLMREGNSLQRPKLCLCISNSRTFAANLTGKRPTNTQILFYLADQTAK